MVVPFLLESKLLRQFFFPNAWRDLVPDCPLSLSLTVFLVMFSCKSNTPFSTHCFYLCKKKLKAYWIAMISHHFTTWKCWIIVILRKTLKWIQMSMRHYSKRKCSRVCILGDIGFPLEVYSRKSDFRGSNLFKI